MSEKKNETKNENNGSGTYPIEKHEHSDDIIQSKQFPIQLDANANCPELTREETYNQVLEIAKEIALKKEGSMFVIGPKEKFKDEYELLFPQLITQHSICEQGMKEILVRLAELDGCFLISDQGVLFAMGARIKKSKSLPGFGTRNAAAAGITTEIPEATAIIISDKIGWIKIYQNGKIVMEMDASKTPPTLNKKIITFLTDKDTALITAAGASAAILGFIPVVIVSGTYLAVKTATGIIRKNFVEDENKEKSKHR